MLTLTVQARGEQEDVEALRTRGLVPAVFYGPKEAAHSVAVDAREFTRVWKEAGYTSLVTLEGSDGKKNTLIHDVQFHPVTGTFLHIDFYVLEKGKKAEVEVPLEWTGSAPAEKTGHIIVKALHELAIKVEPAHLPHTLPVDLSMLVNVGDRITASQIVLPQTGELVTEPEEIVVSVTEFVEEKEEITPAPETVILTAKTDEAVADEEKPTPSGKEEK